MAIEYCSFEPKIVPLHSTPMPHPVAHWHSCFTYCLANLSSTPPLQNIPTPVVMKAGATFCLFLASVSPAKLKERPTSAAVPGGHMYGAIASDVNDPCACPYRPKMALHVWLLSRVSPDFLVTAVVAPLWLAEVAQKGMLWCYRTVYKGATKWRCAGPVGLFSTRTPKTPQCCNSEMFAILGNIRNCRVCSGSERLGNIGQYLSPNG